MTTAENDHFSATASSTLRDIHFPQWRYWVHAGVVASMSEALEAVEELIINLIIILLPHVVARSTFFV